jgi:hypothetical protein
MGPGTKAEWVLSVYRAYFNFPNLALSCASCIIEDRQVIESAGESLLDLPPFALDFYLFELNYYKLRSSHEISKWLFCTRKARQIGFVSLGLDILEGICFW